MDQRQCVAELVVAHLAILTRVEVPHDLQHILAENNSESVLDSSLSTHLDKKNVPKDSSGASWKLNFSKACWNSATVRT